MARKYIQMDFERSNKPPSWFFRPSENARVARAAEQNYPFISLFLLFIFLSVCGWFFESLLYLVNENVLINPGTLHGPWVPIYGAGGLFSLIFLKRWRDRPIIVFVLIIVVCGLIESTTGYFLEALTGARWWDYSGFTFTIGRYLCLEALLAFGIFGMLLIYVIAPAFEERLQKVPQRIQKALVVFLLSLFVVDVLYSFTSPNYAASKRIHVARNAPLTELVSSNVTKM